MLLINAKRHKITSLHNIPYRCVTGRHILWAIMSVLFLTILVEEGLQVCSFYHIIFDLLSIQPSRPFYDSDPSLARMFLEYTSIPYPLTSMDRSIFI
jgi:hypothetical protein